MSHAVENMAYAGHTPWHGLGFKVDQNLTPEQMAKAAKLDWTVSKRPLHYLQNPDLSPEDKKAKFFGAGSEYALVRDSDHRFLDVVGKNWRPVQNADALDFFKKFTEAGKMTMETAGSLWGGRYIWALARVGKDFSLGGKDQVRPYLLLMSPHVHGKALVIQFTPICVVCWNTLNFALGSRLKGDGTGFRMPHTMEFDDTVKAEAEEALGLANDQFDEFKELSQKMSKIKLNTKELDDFFNNVFEFDPEKARKKKKDEEIIEPKLLPMVRAAMTHAPGQQLASRKGTLWGAVNAVTYVIDHEVGKERDTALKSAWIGAKSRIKTKAAVRAAEMVS